MRQLHGQVRNTEEKERFPTNWSSGKTDVSGIKSKERGKDIYNWGTPISAFMKNKFGNGISTEVQERELATYEIGSYGGTSNRQDWGKKGRCSEMNSRAMGA